MRARAKIAVSYDINEYGIYNVQWQGITSEEVHLGSVSGLIDYMERVKAGYDFYCTGLHILGSAIVSEISKNYEFTEEKKPSPGQFTFFAVEPSRWYVLTICTKISGKTHKVYDVFHILPMDEGTIKKSFADAEDSRIEVLRKAILKLKEEGMLDKLTIGSKAFNTAKKMFPDFDAYFPELDIETDSFCRKAYKSGYMYYKEKFQYIGDGVCYDVNNLYPYILENYDLPYGKAYEFDDIDKVPEGALYIAKCNIDAKLKNGKLPIICYKEHGIGSVFVEDTRGVSTYFITSPEIKEIFERYDVYSFEVNKGYYFRKAKGLFKSYVEDFYRRKKEGKTEADRIIAKLMNNNLVGKFGTKPHGSRIMYNEGNYIKIRTEVKTVYVPLVAFLNAYGRIFISKYAQKSDPEKLYYMDTDSIFTSDNIDVPISDKIGDFKIEKKFDSFVCNKMKQYAWHNDEGWNVTVSGVPKSVLNFSGILDESDEEFVKKFTGGFDIESVCSIMSDGIYKENKTTFHIG